MIFEIFRSNTFSLHKAAKSLHALRLNFYSGPALRHDAGVRNVNIFDARMSFCMLKTMMAKWSTVFVGGLLILAAINTGGAARAASFTASLDRDSITLGETATLTLRFDGDAPQNPPSLSEVSGLNFGYVGNQSMNLSINGVDSSIVTYTYAVTPTKSGEFTIPVVATDANGNSISAVPVKLTVTAASAPTAAAVNSGNEVVFLKLAFPKPKIYVGEPVVARLDIYLRDDVQNFGNFQLTSTPADGFTPGKIVELQNQRRRVQVANRVYTIIPLAVPLTAVRTGALTAGPFTANMVVVLPSQNDGGMPLPFFSGEQKQISLATDAAGVESLPLPEANKPANFTGAIGDFTMTASVGPTNVTVGDPVTVRVQISGRGALDAIQLPDQSALNNFKIFPPTTKTETSDQLGLEGQKTFEEIVAPQNSDVREWPQFSFSFFNPDDGKYHTLTQPAVPLVVKAAGATPMPTIAANNNSAPENQTPQDILPIKENLGTLETKSVPLIAQPKFLALQSLPVIAFLAAFVWRKRAENLANNPRLRRQLAVGKLIQNGIFDLQKFAAENKSEEFFALLFRLLQEQLGERLDCPATAITENVVEENSILRGANESTRNDLRELFQLCNQTRYAPVRGTSELNSVAVQFEKVIGELQEVKA
jgi:hypothetical protein